MIQQYSKELLLVVINIMQCINATFFIYSVNVLLLHSYLELLHVAIVFVADEMHSVNNYNYHHNNSLISLQDIPIMLCAIYVRVDFRFSCALLLYHMQAMIITGNIGGAVLVVTAVVLIMVCSVSPIERLHSLTMCFFCCLNTYLLCILCKM